MQTLGRTAEVQFLGNRNEVAQMSQFEILIHMQNILIPLNKILDVIDQQRETSCRGDKNA